MGNGRAERSRKSEESPGKNLTHGLIHLVGQHKSLYSNKQHKFPSNRPAITLSLNPSTPHSLTHSLTHSCQHPSVHTAALPVTVHHSRLAHAPSHTHHAAPKTPAALSPHVPSCTPPRAARTTVHVATSSAATDTPRTGPGNAPRVHSVRTPHARYYTPLSHPQPPTPPPTPTPPPPLVFPPSHQR